MSTDSLAIHHPDTELEDAYCKLASSYKFLSARTVMDLADKLPKRQIIVIYADATAEQAYEVLSKNRILSAPLYDPIYETYTGMIDMIDLVSVLCNDLKSVKSESLLKKSNAAQPLVDQTTKMEVCWFANASSRNPFTPIPPTFSILQASIALSRSDIHRLPVIDYSKRTGRIVGMVTQSNLVDYLFENVEQLGHDLRKRRVEDMVKTRPHLKDVVCIKETDSVLNAFRTIITHRVSGLGVVDEEGRLVECISVSDLKLYSYQPGDDNVNLANLQCLGVCVKDFISKLRAREQRPYSVITCDEDSTLEEVMGEMVVNSVHRVFVVSKEDSTRPVGVVALRDILFEISRSL
eukprot:Rmarinus@m.11907